MRTPAPRERSTQELHAAVRTKSTVTSRAQRSLGERVVRAAEAALADHHYVSALDIFVGMGLLAPAHVRGWRQGRIPYLEHVIQDNLRKISRSMRVFRAWARGRGLKPSETAYLARTRGPRRELRFSKSGDPGIEQAYRTHFVSPELSGKKQERLRARLSAPPEIVVFSTLRDSRCSQCHAELCHGSLLLVENGEPLCLTCADLDHLVYVPRGDPALTHRARRHSALSAVVVRFSRARKRYERQGLLVEEAALEKAQEECLSDAEVRAYRRERDTLRRSGEDEALVERLADGIRGLFPGCPPGEAEAIATHTAARGSGRVGRSAAGRALDDAAVTLAVVAFIRHRYTRYDELRMRGTGRAWARQQVQPRIEEMLETWRRSPESAVSSGGQGPVSEQEADEVHPEAAVIVPDEKAPTGKYPG